MKRIKLAVTMALLALLLAAAWGPGAGQVAAQPGDVCGLGQSTGASPEAAVPVWQEMPAGPSEEDAWPVVRVWTETHVAGNGENITVAYTLRRNPNPAPAPGILATSCTYKANESLQRSQTIQGITQYLKSSYYRYSWSSSGQTYHAYQIYKTTEWWTRTSTVYTVGKSTTTWTYNGWDCSNVYSTKTSTGAVTPNWQTSTRTYDYIYDFTKTWPVKTPGPYLSMGLIKTSQTTPAYKSGAGIGTLATETVLSGQ